MNDGMKWYGNWAAFLKEPTQEEYDGCVEALKKSIERNTKLEIAWETMKVIYRTPEDNLNPFETYIDEETGEEKEAPPMWTIGLKVKARERET